MHDSYEPSPVTTATCPHCGAVVAGAPGAAPDVLPFALLRLTCPGCGMGWKEAREGSSAQRFWLNTAPPGSRRAL